MLKKEEKLINMNTLFSVPGVVMMNMANFEKEFQRIESFRRLVHGEILGQQRFERVEVGTIQADEGNPFGVVLDNYNYQLRFTHDPSEPRLLKWGRKWVVGLEESGSGELVAQGIERVYKPIAYRADLEELPSGILVPLLDKIEEI